MRKLVRTTIEPSQFRVKFKNATGEELDDEIWINEVYQVNVRRGLKFADNIMTHLSIKRRDKQAKPDWRDFQWIKNQLTSSESEAIEIYPKESRLVDGANQYHLWCFEEGVTLPFGFHDGRVVSEKSFVGETQRKFPEYLKPADLKESEERILQMLQNHYK